MFQLLKLYSDNEVFDVIEFKLGINLILGTESNGSNGASSRKMNGVGKSLVVELINFCLLKKTDQSRIFTIPDAVIPKSEYINLHFKSNNQHYIFSRNKKGDIKVKSGIDGDFIVYTDGDARNYLRTILHLNTLDISARDYINFLIKEENYNYKEFGELYRMSNHSSMLKVHFFFYGLPIEILSSINSSLEEHTEATKLIKKIKDSLSIEGIELEDLEAKKNQYDDEMRSIEENLDYEKLLNNIGNEKEEFLKIENDVANLWTEKSILQGELDEINSFTDVFSEDIYIDDNDLQIVFNKYSLGLGDIIKKDLESLKKFRTQLIDFNNEFLNIKRKELESKIAFLTKKITSLNGQISKSTKNILSDSTNTVINNFRLYKEKNNNFDHYNVLLKEKKIADVTKETSKFNFSNYVKELYTFWEAHNYIFESINRDFVKIHKDIMGNAECNFKVVIENIFKAKSFFKFEVSIEGKGSKGINQTAAVIYDLTLLYNEYTKVNHIGFIIHDNLIFGSIDKDTSAQILNYLNKLDPSTFQYIATVNVDDFSYCEVNNLFKDDYRKKDVIVELTKHKPLFRRQWGHQEK